MGRGGGRRLNLRTLTGVSDFLDFLDMTTVADSVHDFAIDLAADPGGSHPWLAALRARGMAAFRAQGFPTTRHEEWRDTNISALAQTRFSPANASESVEHAARGIFEQFTFGHHAAAELVFINGHFSPALSRIARLPRGVQVQSIRQAINTDAAALESNLGKIARIDAHPLAALATASFGDGAFVHLSSGAVCEKPIHLLFLSVPGE